MFSNLNPFYYLSGHSNKSESVEETTDTKFDGVAETNYNLNPLTYLSGYFYRSEQVEDQSEVLKEGTRIPTDNEEKNPALITEGHVKIKEEPEIIGDSIYATTLPNSIVGAATSRKIAKQNIGIANQQIEIARQQIETAKQQIDTAKQQIDTAKQQIETAKQQIETAKQQIETANQQIEIAKQQIETAKQQIETANQQIEIEKKHISTQTYNSPLTQKIEEDRENESDTASKWSVENIIDETSETYNNAMHGNFSTEGLYGTLEIQSPTKTGSFRKVDEAVEYWDFSPPTPIKNKFPLLFGKPAKPIDYYHPNKFKPDLSNLFVHDVINEDIAWDNFNNNSFMDGPICKPLNLNTDTSWQRKMLNNTNLKFLDDDCSESDLDVNLEDLFNRTI